MATIAVGIGLMEFPFKTASGFWRWVDLCEQGGLDSIWQTDRLISGAPMLECMSVMAALAGRTQRILFGMNVLGLGVRDPVVVAKECATIDYLSEGRLLPAFGVGSPRSPDWAGTGRTYAGSGKRVDESLEIIGRLWAGETLDFDGEFYSCKGARINPLPARKRLPIWYGGGSRAAVRRTARFATGWLGGPETPPEAARVVKAIRAACDEAGRRIPDDHYGAGFFYRFGSRDDAAVAERVALNQARLPGVDPWRMMAVGDTAVIAERIRQYVAGGVTKFVLRPIGVDDEDVMAQTRLLAERLLPEIANMNDANLGEAAFAATGD
jgi:probable F420-dependent oxidoreductase